MPRALAKNGRAQFTGHKAATVDCPGCCGPGEDQCCFCVDLDAAPGDLCYPKGYLPPFLCNNIRKCCCGSRVRIIGRISVTQRLDRYDINTAWVTYWETNEWEFEAALLWHIERQQDGTCKTIFDGVDYLAATRHREYQFGAGIVHVEDSMPDLNFEPNQVLRPELMCRPEPYHLWYDMAPFGDGVLPGAEDPILDPFKDTCSAEVNRTEHIDPDNNGGFEQDNTWNYSWSGSGSCKIASVDASGAATAKTVFHPAYGEPYTTFEETRTGSRKVSTEVEVLEDDCCEGPGGTPYNPAPPLVPVDPDNPGLGYICPRCGMKMEGDKCRACGFCNGCGG